MEGRDGLWRERIGGRYEFVWDRTRRSTGRGKFLNSKPLGNQISTCPGNHPIIRLASAYSFFIYQFQAYPPSSPLQLHSPQMAPHDHMFSERFKLRTLPASAALASRSSRSQPSGAYHHVTTATPTLGPFRLAGPVRHTPVIFQHQQFPLIASRSNIPSPNSA